MAGGKLVVMTYRCHSFRARSLPRCLVFCEDLVCHHSTPVIPRAPLDSSDSDGDGTGKGKGTVTVTGRQ